MDLGCFGAELGPDDSAPTEATQHQIDQRAQNRDKTDKADYNKSQNHRSNGCGILASECPGEALTEETENRHPAENFDDDSEKNESNEDGNANQDKGEETGKHTQGCVNDDAQKADAENRPEVVSDL